MAYCPHISPGSGYSSDTNPTTLFCFLAFAHSVPPAPNPPLPRCLTLDPCRIPLRLCSSTRPLTPLQVALQRPVPAGSSLDMPSPAGLPPDPGAPGRQRHARSRSAWQGGRAPQIPLDWTGYFCRTVPPRTSHSPTSRCARGTPVLVRQGLAVTATTRVRHPRKSAAARLEREAHFLRAVARAGGHGRIRSACPAPNLSSRGPQTSRLLGARPAGTACPGPASQRGSPTPHSPKISCE